MKTTFLFVAKVDIDQLEHRRYPRWILSHTSTPPLGTVSPSKQRRHLEESSSKESQKSNLGRPSESADDGQASKSTGLVTRMSSVENRQHKDFETQMKQRYRPIVLLDLEQESGPKTLKQDLKHESMRGNTAQGETDPYDKTHEYEITGYIVSKEDTPKPSQSLTKVPSVNINYNTNLLTTEIITAPTQKGLPTSKTFSPLFPLGLNPSASPYSSLPVSYSVSPSVDLDMETDTTIDSPKPTLQPLSRELSKHTIHSRVETVNSTTSATGIRIENLESLRKPSITPVSVPDNPFEKTPATSKEMHSLPDNHSIIKGFFRNKEKRYSSTFLNVKSTIGDSPTTINSKEVKERKLVTPMKLRNSSRKLSGKRRRASKGKKKTGKNALKLLERCQNLHKTPNKLGEFYNDNIPMLTPHMEAKKIDLDGSISGIAYDDDNLKARQMQNTPLNGDDERRSTKSVTFRPTSSELRNYPRKTPFQNSSPLGHANSPHAWKSPHSLSKDKIENGCEYFLENESAVIVLNVKKKGPVGEERVRSVREDLPSVYEECEEDEEEAGNEKDDLEDEDEENDDEQGNDDGEADEDEHDEDDEDDDDEEDDEDDDDEDDDDEDQDTDESDNKEDVAKEFHGKKFMTAMKITYGDVNGHDSDPDRMIMTKYGEDFETQEI
ncbi:hypothetical protein DPMN_111799 [Dreissena polymorpha]|uniref:Uncharacterized protein n=1 Tax=Dreissena polymorpha TaxID=45954 RepID=A0A9D4KF38_DREPO|nr:hypothetical protein DPMN_111799 [Dreissena polymorpha]